MPKDVKLDEAGALYPKGYAAGCASRCTWVDASSDTWRMAMHMHKGFACKDPCKPWWWFRFLAPLPICDSAMSLRHPPTLELFSWTPNSIPSDFVWALRELIPMLIVRLNWFLVLFADRCKAKRKPAECWNVDGRKSKYESRLLEWTHPLPFCPNVPISAIVPTS